ncbi:hypothetical protein ALC53_08073 [Atta colombica]|uniref:Uncharacterized protein n=1 Tax=Atta colombica TaxID=520822 RepID=A0A151I2H4_9HYME|nr:hypothetical protein ALC53_08073 [Atta colombica]
MIIICMMFMICDILADNENTKRKLPASRFARSSQRHTTTTEPQRLIHDFG